MRFAATHKAVSYLMVSTAVLLLILTGEIPFWQSILVLFSIVASFFFDPQKYPFMLGPFYANVLQFSGFAVSTLILWFSIQMDELWECGMRLSVVFLLIKLWHRRNNADYLQAYITSFIIFLSATLIEYRLHYIAFIFLYAVFTMWTLTLFHLRREMEENYLLKHLPGRHGQAAESERVEVERILNSRRVVGPRFLLVTTAVGVGTLLLASGLFMLLPRTQQSFELPFQRRALPTMGFSERIELGGHGLLRENPRIVMRVELPGQMPPLRLRGVTFARYDQGRWSQLRIPEQSLPVSRPEVLLKKVPPQTELGRAEIHLEPIDTSSLFVPTPGDVVSLSFPEKHLGLTGPLKVRSDDQLALPGRRAPLHYTVRFQPSTAPPERKAKIASDYLQLPPTLESTLHSLAAQMVGDATDPVEQANRLRNHLQKNYGYTTRLWKPSQSEPIVEFLTSERKGHCEYFATAMALLLRSLQIPSRTVNGYLTAEWNRYGGFFVVRQQHAHSWVEVFLNNRWEVFDPTPPQPVSPMLPIFYPVRQLFDGLNMGFGKYVIEYDQGAQRQLGERFSSLWKRSEPRHVALPSFGVWPLLFGVCVLGLLFGVGRYLWRHRPHFVATREPKQFAEGTAVIQSALLILRRRGFHRSPGETLQMLAERLAEHGEPAAPIFAKLVEHYYAHRFSGSPLDRSTAGRLLHELRRLKKRQPTST